MNMGGLSGLDDLNDMYESIILDHYRNPRNSEKIENSDFEINVNNPFCGDELFIQLKLNEDIVEDLSISGNGCAISQSSGSLLAESIQNLNKDQILSLITNVRKMMKDEDISEEDRDSLGDIEALEGVKKFPVRIKCALLGWAGLEDLIKDKMTS